MAKNSDRLNQVILDARRSADKRAAGYREQALKLYPWVCGVCARTFTHGNLQLLEVHHKNGNHDDNPPDGSNWELLCHYCHDNEHQRQTEALANKGVALDGAKAPTAKFNPFADLKSLMDEKKKEKK